MWITDRIIYSHPIIKDTAVKAGYSDAWHLYKKLKAAEKETGILKWPCIIKLSCLFHGTGSQCKQKFESFRVFKTGAVSNNELMWAAAASELQSTWLILPAL